jgi:hypothetical protein
MDNDMAAAIFSLTDAIPGADVGRAVHRIDLNSGMLTSEVRLTVFPGITGVVVTKSTVSGVTHIQQAGR